MKKEDKIIRWSVFQGCDISISPLVLNSSIPLLCIRKINKTTIFCDHRNWICGTVPLKIYWFLGTGLLDMHLHHIFNCYQLYTYKYQLFNWHSYFTTNKITIICCSEILHLCILINSTTLYVIHSLRFVMNWSIHASLDSYRYHPVDWGIYVCIQSALL